MLAAAGVASIAFALFAVLLAQDIATPTPSKSPAPTATPATVPLAVQAYADRVTPSFAGVVRLDRKVVVRVADVAQRDAAIPGATSGTWAVAVAGDIRQTWGLLARPNSQCAVWFVTQEGLPVAWEGGTLDRCEPYFSAVPIR